VASRRSELKAVIRELAAELAGIPEGPDLESLPEGSVIRFVHVFTKADPWAAGESESRSYTYAAVKIKAGLWSTTGGRRSDPWTDDELAEFIGTGPCIVFTDTRDITAGNSDGDADDDE